MSAHFLADPPSSAVAAQQAESDQRDRGYVMNLTRLWAYQPEAKQALFDLLSRAARDGGLADEQLRVLVPAVASALGDSYCSVAWGSRLAEIAGAETAANVLRGNDKGLSPAEEAMARWARKLVEHPSSTTQDDVAGLRAVGFTDAQIFAMTLFAALRVAFSTVNGALGAHPDAAFRTTAPDAVLEAIDYGRPIGG